ncbi:MAG: ring-cleaving dioxygenase [Pyrinomonas methylaliphatogenes]|nr:ring-cleaving dioxygenase [Pyrinomonas methylaliphatogenes]
MDQRILGIHHVTAIANNAQRNLDFYTGVLGLRLVKLTVNFDDPTSYHLYYGDENGSPGTLLTFFVWPDVPRGRRGTGQAITVSFAVPESSTGYWIERFTAHNVEFTRPMRRFDDQVIPFRDPDGLMLELVARPVSDLSARAQKSAWTAPVPFAHAIRGLDGVTLCVESLTQTESLLVETMNFNPVRREEGIVRYEIGLKGFGTTIDVRCAPEIGRGLVAAGSIHHVAWRTSDEITQREWQQEIARRGLNVTPVMNRVYFRSIYFREPGGVLFEIATDGPGFTVDEPLERLGSELRLPPWLESARDELERALPPLRLPNV